MIDLKKALEIAKKYYAEIGISDITSISETVNIWIVDGGIKGQKRIGSIGIMIDKQTGEVKSFNLPNKSNFELLKTATRITLD